MNAEVLDATASASFDLRLVDDEVASGGGDDEMRGIRFPVGQRLQGTRRFHGFGFPSVTRDQRLEEGGGE